MAFSMFLRNSVCMNRLASQQIVQLATHRALAPLSNSSYLTLKENISTPILNSVRSFRTSTVRLSDEKPHDHARLWVIEKATSVLLVPLIPIGLLLPNKLIDTVLAVLITAHTFWGWEAIAVDYVRASIFGPLLPKIAIGLVYLLCISTLGGLFYLISHDGLCQSIKQIWAIKSKQA